MSLLCQNFDCVSLFKGEFKPLDLDDRCDTAWRCYWCDEPLETGTSDRFEGASQYLGCCRFCKELE